MCQKVNDNKHHYYYFLGDVVVEYQGKENTEIYVPSLFPYYCTHNLCKAKMSHKILFANNVYLSLLYTLYNVQVDWLPGLTM